MDKTRATAGPFNDRVQRQQVLAPCFPARFRVRRSSDRSRTVEPVADPVYGAYDAVLAADHG